jgi:hypothetical protein
MSSDANYRYMEGPAYLARNDRYTNLLAKLQNLYPGQIKCSAPWLRPDVRGVRRQDAVILQFFEYSNYNIHCSFLGYEHVGGQVEPVLRDIERRLDQAAAQHGW